ncbi:histidine kinase [Luteolibacter luteus]|uniref:Histidine kinase domain-containing protein n=1 Tax=Luteolibacter luteus TaxID=2728835 RepID=A0A858RJB5_9BACT|nr:histidine kinase [Luteolibacter luteus]QJE96499.1 hypothetical protein HHL09_12140 [Luteolibacter luteus]
MTRRRCFEILLILLPGLLSGQEASWEYRLANSLSARPGKIEKELQAIEAELPGLPNLPVGDQGGTGGLAIRYGGPLLKQEGELSITVRFKAPGMADLIALVPARRYGVYGPNPDFGTPEAFSVYLIGETGQTVAKIAEVNGAGTNPVRSGHPYVFPVSPPVQAWGMKIIAEKLPLDSDDSDHHVHAWAEALAFQGDHNLARGAEVDNSGGSPPPAPWQWSNDYLVDGQTPLGLPEIPGELHANVGWMSDARDSARDPVWFELDLGGVREFDSIRLFPAKRPTSDLPSGFGFPKNFVISVWDGQPKERGRMPLVEKRIETANPGHNPFLVSMGPCKGSHVRIEITELWKVYEKFPAFAALSEVEILKGETNVGLGSLVRTSGMAGTIISSGSQYWSLASLTDGYGPEGKLVSDRSWLLSLNHRLELETSRYHLQKERDEIVGMWRRSLLATVVILGAVGAVVLVALPLRYRLRSKRQLEEVRDRIAGDLHDEVGSNLGSIQMFADLAERRTGGSGELKNIQRIAAETVSAVRDIVWLLRPGGDHRIATVEHLRETCSIMLETHDWKFTANEPAWACEMSDDANRNLFLYVREALHNILRHAEAAKVQVQVEVARGQFHLVIADDGRGIDAERLARPATFRALRKRAEALQASFTPKSEPGQGTELTLVIPLDPKHALHGK